MQFLPESRLRELGGLYEKVCRCLVPQMLCSGRYNTCQVLP